MLHIQVFRCAFAAKQAAAGVGALGRGFDARRSGLRNALPSNDGGDTAGGAPSSGAGARGAGAPGTCDVVGGGATVCTAGKKYPWTGTGTTCSVYGPGADGWWANWMPGTPETEAGRTRWVLRLRGPKSVAGWRAQCEVPSAPPKAGPGRAAIRDHQPPRVGVGSLNG